MTGTTPRKGPVVIICTGLEGISITGGEVPEGQYLAAYDPDAHGGLGAAEWTADPAGALVFGNFIAAFETWRQTSKVRPRRPDGAPNRPLTAFTVTFAPAPQTTPATGPGGTQGTIDREDHHT